MTLTTRGRYATRIMVCLARHRGDKPVRRQEIAEAEGIPPDYVGQILMKLKTAGLVNSHRGTNGGFSLAREAATINIAEILAATEGNMALVPCLDSVDCSRNSSCATRELWQRAETALNEVLTGTTVAEVAGRAQELEQNRPLTFSI